MKKETILVYIADCGRQYKSRNGCVSHEKICKCFSNPKFRACHSCSFNGGFVSEDGDRYRNCLNSLWDYDFLKPFTIPNTATFDCINCPIYKPKEPFLGLYEKWTGYPKNKTNIEHQVSVDSLPF